MPRSRHSLGKPTTRIVHAPISDRALFTQPISDDRTVGRVRAHRPSSDLSHLDSEGATNSKMPAKNKKRCASPAGAGTLDEETETELERCGSLEYLAPLEDPEEEAQPKQKKRIRVSKKEIPQYKWTGEGTRKLAEFVMQHPQLFDKRQKDWLNLTAKNQLWATAGEEQDPPATGAQCKKHYENMRTRVGKIMKREAKSGSGQAQRSVRDEEIMSTWPFLIQHIVRGNTHSSEEFSDPRLTTPDDPEEEDDDLSSTGGDVVPPSWRKGKAKKSWPSFAASSQASPSPVPSSVAATSTRPDLRETFMQILSKADALAQTPPLSGHRRIVHDFACLLEGHMQTIPENSWHNFQIECLNLVQKYKQQTLRLPSHHGHSRRLQLRKGR